MVDHDRLVEGATFSHSRTFTVEAVEAFAALSGDAGEHHLVAGTVASRDPREYS